jgi:hypothetical protein
MRAAESLRDRENNERATPLLERKLSMRRSRMALLGLFTIIGLLVPAAAHAGTVSAAKPQEAQVAGAHAGISPAVCASLRTNLHKPSLNCSYVVAIRPSGNGPASATAMIAAEHPSAAAYEGTYWTGWLKACSDPNCSLSRWGSWYALDEFGVTWWNKVGVWDNWHRCSGYGNLDPRITWCGVTQNGWYTYMQEGDNFGTDGWARINIDTYANWELHGSSYAYLYGCLEPPGYCD